MCKRVSMNSEDTIWVGSASRMERGSFRQEFVAPLQQNIRKFLKDDSTGVVPKAESLQAKAFQSVGAEDAGAWGVLKLDVSNQSSATPSVDIQVSIDERQVIDEVFHFDMGHTRKSYDLPLAKGSHVIRVVGDQGSARYEGVVEVQGRHWAMLLYWYEPGEPGRPDLQSKHFTFDMRDKPAMLR
jgi:hypothetical protein